MDWSLRAVIRENVLTQMIYGDERWADTEWSGSISHRRWFYPASVGVV